MPTVLIADDSRYQCQVLATYLAPKGFEPVFAADAMQAWVGALRSRPDLILLDINMPGGTGIEVLKRLRMSTRTQHIPVIVITGMESPEIESVVRGLGASDFLRKPVERDHLCDAVDRVLPVQCRQAKSMIAGQSGAD